MKRLFAFAILTATATGCSTVTSGMPGMTPATGEAWYTKDTNFLGLTFASAIYYCSKESPGKCTKAELVSR